MGLREFFSFFNSRSETSLSALAGSTRSRLAGPPTSSNGASSFHLWLDVGIEPLVSASATIEVLQPPQVDRLVFWAFQVSFLDGAKKVGAGHFGLQNYSKHPNSGAINWGGYHSGGGELPGSVSALASAADNLNTRDYEWLANRQYRYKIEPSPEQGWRASITDLSTGTETVVRDLHVSADALTSPVVWTESFANCEESGVAVRWSDIEVVTRRGQVIRPESGTTSYQTFANGGCSNTTFELDGVGVIQMTGTPRTIEGRQRIPLKGP